MPPGPHCHQWAHIGPHVHSHGAKVGSNEYDQALKEAIRRSLQDVTAKKAPVEDKKEEEIVVEAQSDIKTESVETEEAKDSAPNLTAPCEELEEEPNDVAFATSSKNAPAETEEASVDDEDTDAKPAAVERTENSSSEQTQTDDIFPWDAITISRACPSFAADAIAIGDVDAIVISRPCPSFAADAIGNGDVDDSFASDAIGSGDVAEAMGKALDIVAGVISDLLSEADSRKEEPEADSHKEEPEADSCKEEPEIVVVEPEAESPASGAMILDSVQSTQNREESVSDIDNEWHVVTGFEESETESCCNQDEEIARAAELLGSALFNSMRSSGEAVSTLSNGDSFSLASSVPSIVPSISLGTQTVQVPAAQLNRWAVQLIQLHELGFDDEAQCVDVLERLNAANIGVEADEEVSVTQVVNALLKN
jgi:hypothetical protein